MLSILTITSLQRSFSLDKLEWFFPRTIACSFQICRRKILRLQLIIYIKKRWVSFLILQRQSSWIKENPFKPCEYDCVFGQANAQSKQTLSKWCLYYWKIAFISASQIKEILLSTPKWQDAKVGVHYNYNVWP